MRQSPNAQQWLSVGLVAAALLGTARADIIFPPHPNAGEVNFSGASLFRPFFFSPATTNDYIDVDGDGFAGFDPNTPPYVDQLASNYSGGPTLNTFWAVSYRSVGSINGFGEFVDWQLCGVFSGAVPAEDGFLNRFAWASGGNKLNGPGVDCLDDEGYQNPDGTTDNDDGSPFCRNSVDGAAIDVPGAWAVKGPADPAQTRWNQTPTASGYGENPITSNTGWVSELQTLTRQCDPNQAPVSLNTNATPDENTIFDTKVAWGPIVYIANRGVGRPDLDGTGGEGDIRITDVKHLMVSGRLRHGENLAGATRSAGSGTRNGIMNTSGIDPAWGRGENLDNEWAVTSDAHLGANRRISNAQGSSGVERAVQVSRLAIGFTGLAGNERAAFDAAAGRYEILNIRFDDRGGTGFVRPTVDTVLDNADASTGWQLGGEVTFVTRGDPFEDNAGLPQYMESRPAAWYVRNIITSANDFAGAPGSEEQYNMPGEYLATVYFLNAGIDAFPNTTNPTQFLPNANLNVVLQEYMRDNNGLGIGSDTPTYGSKNPAGQVPSRKTKTGGYLDGQTSAYAYKRTNGTLATIAGGLRLAARNKVQGDFNRDAARNILDIPQLLVAYQNPLDFEQGMGTWPPGGSNGDQVENVVIAHVIGDFDGNGDLDAADVRYFADGLALDPNQPALDPGDPQASQYGLWLNRRQGFIDVDVQWQILTGSNNFFATTLATGKTYAPGDSAGDIAGSAGGPVAGADPRGADGVVNAADIDRVYWAFRNQYLGCENTQVDWSNLDQAVYSDLSADMTGPELVGGRRTILINQADVDHLVQVILGTDYGDVDLDGDVDAADEAVVQANQGQTNVGWAGGDLNGDCVVDGADLAFFSTTCAGDLNCDGVVDFGDINPFVKYVSNCATWQAAYPGCPGENGDINGNGQHACNGSPFDDINAFVALIQTAPFPCP